jgi:threonine/homoserine/homoserine lactone efflux protein
MSMLFLKTALIGLSIAAPVGPIGLLCMERTLRRGRVLGLATGFGAACADAVYGAVGVLGMSAITVALVQMKTMLNVVGAVFLLYLAYRTWTAASSAQATQVQGGETPLRAFAGTFLLTLSNPMTILSFIAIFAALSPPGLIGAAEKLLMVTGVLLGSAAWWLFLVFGVSGLSGAIDARMQLRIRRASALLLGGFGVWQLVQMLH